MGAAAADRAKKPRAKEMFSDSESDSDASMDTGSDSDSDSGARARASKSRKPSNVVGEADALTINAKYAARFEHNKRREETQRLQEKVKREYILRPGDEDEDSDDESSSSESDEGDLPERFDEQFAKALVRIKRKDPEIYKPDVELFSDASESSSDDDSATSDDNDDDAAKKNKKKEKKSKGPKKETLREVTARQLLEGGARAFEEDEEAPSKPAGKSYVEEQADLKNAFKAAAAAASASDSDSDGDSDSDSDRGGLKVKRRAEKPDEGAAAEAKAALGEYFGGEDEVSKEDAFLRDFLLNEKWKEDETKLPDHGGYGSSSEEEVEEAEKFEQKYNFRFEEPDGGVIVSHARKIEGTVRRENTARRDARAARKERKLSEKERLKAEVRRLKNLKREEIQAKMRQIATVGGLAGADAVAAANLNAEFDPEEHDRMMSAMYGDEYYDGAVLGEDGEALEKPEFGDLDEEVRELMGNATEEDGGAAEESEKFQKLRAALAATSSGRVDDGGDDIDDGSDDDDDEDDDEGAEGAEGAEEAPNAGNKFSKRAAKRWKKELMAKMDEYYKLDAEDFIEDVPCRFKYKEVAPSMYGLTTKDILSMTDKQLTQIVPLKKLAPYRHDADAGMDAKTKARSQRMAREFLAEAAKSKAERRKGKKGKKKGGKDDEDDANDDADAEAVAAEERKASYGARAWGKHNLNKKRKEPEGGSGGGSGGGDAAKSAPSAEPAAPPKPGQGKNAKKNLKKRQKRNELERAKAAGMIS